MIVDEALKRVPEEARSLAGRNVGTIIVGATHALGEVATLAKWIASVPRGIGAFGMWAVRRWRRMPPEKRLLPPSTLLLTAGTGHAKTTDAGLRAAFENLVASAMDKDTAPRVHPAFARNLSEMTPLEARIMRHFRTGGLYPTVAEFSAALGVDADSRAIAIATTNLERLGFIRIEGGATMVVGQSFSAVPSSTPSPEPGLIHVGKIEYHAMTVDNRAASVPLTVYGTYSLTALGHDFIDVVAPIEG
jgi:hypothetical protein